MKITVANALCYQIFDWIYYRDKKESRKKAKIFKNVLIKISQQEKKLLICKTLKNKHVFFLALISYINIHTQGDSIVKNYEKVKRQKVLNLHFVYINKCFVPWSVIPHHVFSKVYDMLSSP